MVKKNLFKTLAAVSAMSVLMTSTVFAAEWNENGGSQTVTGTNYPIEAVIEVELPGDLSFGINPLKIDADGDTETTGDNTQIISEQYLITNYSQVPVAVTAATKLTVADGVEIIDAPEASNYDGNSKELKSSADEKRAIVLTQMVPTAAPTVTADGEVTLTTTPWTPASDAATIEATGRILNDSDSSIIFKLAANPNQELTSTTAACVSGFVFSGAVDPSKSYAEEDVTVTTVFTLKTLTPAEADDTDGIYEADSTFTGTVDTSIVTTK